MTTICLGGTSSARDGFAASLFMGPSAIAALLNNIPTAWAVPLAAYIGYITYNLSTFCTVDPPTLPTITAQDCFDLLNVYNPVVNIPAAAKFQDFIGYYVWHQVCKCDSGFTPNPAAGQAAPAGAPAFNPPRLGGQPAGVPCAEYQFSHTFQAVGDIFDASILLPDNVTYVTVDAQFPDADPYPDRYAWNANFHDSAGGNVLPTAFVGWNTSHQNFHTYADIVGAGAVSFQNHWVVSSHSLPAPVTMTLTMRVYCGTTPTGSGGVVQVPCPPDEVVQGLLDRILQMVTLIQRQSVPFAYVRGTVHSGLTGMGEIAVQGLLGVLVTITAHGSVTGVELADPDLFFEAGWFQWGTADGFELRRFINCSPQLDTPREAGQYTRIGYTLPVGVTISITELVREP